MNYAGKYLKEYEGSRYTFLEKYAPSILVPTGAEEFSDVSFYQAGMKWDVYAESYSAAILRIGQGAWKDSEFETNYYSARANGIILGGYFFYDGRFSPNEQARVVIAALQDKFFEIELYVDWERNYGGSYEGLRYVITFMKLLEAAGLNVKAVGMYTGYYYFIENTVYDHDLYPYLANKPLWIAWYAAASMVKIPAPWTNWTNWQYGTVVKYVGQPTEEIDMNYRNGRISEGVKMYVKGKVNATAGLNVRAAPNTTAEIIGKLLYDTVVEGDLVNGWIYGTFPGVVGAGYILAQYVTYAPYSPENKTVVEVSYDNNVVTGVTVDGIPWVKSS